MKMSIDNFKLNLDKSKTYLLACSFGPDSMSLFNLLLTQGFRFIVCHVNYHKRDVSNFEEESLRNLCLKNNIPFEALDTTNLKCVGNFQSWARDVRYKFFAECYKKYNAQALLVAHQEDDLIETYLMQMDRHAFVSYYGIKEVTIIDSMRVIRPLLHFSKKELLDYDIKNNIPYSIDVSNLSDHYTRNKYRHNVIEKLIESEREEYRKLIENKNVVLRSKILELSRFIVDQKYIDIESIKNLSFEDFSILVYSFINIKGFSSSISNERMNEFYRYLNSKKSNIIVKLSNDVLYCQEYGRIYLLLPYKKYSYLIEKPGIYSFNEFDIELTNDSEDRNISPDSYPLTIRNAYKNDEYKVKDYKKSVRRLFIDFKMPEHLRSAWPVIVDRNGEIIYIPRYRKEYKDTHKTKFKIKLY